MIKNSVIYKVGNQTMNMDTRPQHRTQNDITSKNIAHKINLDRRLKNNERRDQCFFSVNYNSPARRFTIDRRLKA